MTINSIKSILTEFNNVQLDEISSYILEVISNKKEEKYSLTAHINNGIICPKCGSTKCVKNGMEKDKQRFICKECSKSFRTTTGSAISSTKLENEKWIEYIKCMINGKSIRKSAEIVGVCVKTSFYMRHKVLDAIKAYEDRGKVSGIVEMDETFLAESYKGNHKKSGFKIPRKSRKRGKEVTKRGISREQICIGTAIDKNGNIIMEMTCRGRITSKKLDQLYNGNVPEGTTICTDSYSSYKTLSRKLKLKHKQIPTGKHSDGIFNLSSINSLHSRFKTWIRKFNGVSTKFLPNYLTWFKWLEKTKGMKEAVRPEQMWNDAMAKQVDVRIEILRQREPVWV